jgi:hypothetical protein
MHVIAALRREWREAIENKLNKTAISDSIIDLPNWRRSDVGLADAVACSSQASRRGSELMPASWPSAAPTKQSLHECRDALRELRAAVLARQKAQDALADLNRERSIQRASSWARSGITAAMKFPKLFDGFSAWG